MSSSLKKRLADNGFESNEDFEFALACLFESKVGRIRCLHVAGQQQRRTTAFATALSKALEFPRVVYLDLSPQTEPMRVNSAASQINAKAATAEHVSEHAHHPDELPMTAFERALTEACAFSEAERTILILDQLHTAEFRDQNRLYQLIQTGEWSLPSGSVFGSDKNLLVTLCADQALYHSLAHVSFRIWTDATGTRFDHRPSDFSLGPEFQNLFEALSRLFEGLNTTPTASELKQILDDLHHRVRTEEQLRQSLFGRMELVDRARLIGLDVWSALGECVQVNHQLIGLDHIEIT